MECHPYTRRRRRRRFLRSVRSSGDDEKRHVGYQEKEGCCDADYVQWAAPIPFKEQPCKDGTIDANCLCSEFHFHSGKFLAEIAATPFITSSAIRLVTNDSQDNVRRPASASAISVPTLKRTNHCFLLTSSCSFFMLLRRRSGNHLNDRWWPWVGRESSRDCAAERVPGTLEQAADAEHGSTGIHRSREVLCGLLRAHGQTRRVSGSQRDSLMTCPVALARIPVRSCDGSHHGRQCSVREF